MAALVLRIKFPRTYPLIYKTLRVDANFTTKEGVAFIAETVNVKSLLTGNEGLYVPDEKRRSEEHTSELQSLMRSSYAVFCLKKKNMSMPARTFYPLTNSESKHVHTPVHLALHANCHLLY